MHNKIIEFNNKQRTAKLPELRAGDTVRIHRKIVEEGKERVQVFEGLILGIKGAQSSSPMLTVRKVSFGVGVELIVPLYSPNIEKLELLKRAKVRHSKVYFVRHKSDRELKRKLKDVPLTEEDIEGVSKAKTEEAPKEAPAKKKSTEAPKAETKKSAATKDATKDKEKKTK